MYDAILSRFLSVAASMLLFPLPSGINPIRELLPGHRASRKWILIQGIPILGIQSRISIRPGKATVGFVPTTLRTHFRTSVRGIKGNPYSFMRCTAIWYRMYSAFSYIYFFERIFRKCIRKINAYSEITRFEIRVLRRERSRKAQNDITARRKSVRPVCLRGLKGAFRFIVD